MKQMKQNKISQQIEIFQNWAMFIALIENETRAVVFNHVCFDDSLMKNIDLL